MKSFTSPRIFILTSVNDASFNLAHGLVRCKLEHRCWRAHGEDVSFTDVKIKILDEKCDQGMWMTSCRFEKSQLVEIETWARPDEFVCYGRRTWWGADGKVSIERWYLSPYVEKPFNSKVIKSFVPELRSRKCFSCFGIPMFYVYMLWTFYVHFNSHAWLCYISNLFLIWDIHHVLHLCVNICIKYMLL